MLGGTELYGVESSLPSFSKSNLDDYFSTGFACSVNDTVDSCFFAALEFDGALLYSEEFFCTFSLVCRSLCFASL